MKTLLKLAASPFRSLYSESIAGSTNANPIGGISLGRPANSNGDTFTDSYFPDLFSEARPVLPHTLKLYGNPRVAGGGANNWGLYVFNGGDPATSAQKYASVIAHELGHVFGLKHRTSAPYDEGNDGIDAAAQQNVMSSGADLAHEDFDLIQAEAIQGSGVFAK